MIKNKGSKDFLYAANICDGELIQKNRFYRLNRLNLRYSSYPKLDWKTVDSVGKFMSVVEEYARLHCCEAVLRCTDVQKSK